MCIGLACPSVSQSICLSVYLPIFPSVHLSVCLCVGGCGCVWVGGWVERLGVVRVPRESARLCALACRELVHLVNSFNRAIVRSWAGRVRCVRPERKGSPTREANPKNRGSVHPWSIQKVYSYCPEVKTKALLKPYTLQKPNPQTSK